MRCERILVTGAAGNVGREVARACLERGMAVRLADRRPERLGLDGLDGGGSGEERAAGREIIRFDFTDRATWDAALDGCDGMFLVRPPALSDMASTLCPLVTRAEERGVRHIVFLSVAGAERRSWVPHRKVELHLEASRGDYTSLRAGFFAQNLREAYRLDIVEDDRIYVPAGQGRVTFIDVRDIGEVAARVFETPDDVRWARRALTLTGPEAVSFHEAAALLGRALGRPIRYEAASVPGYLWHLARRRRLPLLQAIIQTVLHVGLRRGEAAEVDPTTAEVLGRRPRDLAQYVVDDREVWR